MKTILRNVILTCSLCLIAGRSPAVPVIRESPADAVGFIGGSAGFHVEATGNGTLTYEWSVNGTPISGSDDESLNLTNLSLSSVGAYKVRIEDDDGAVESRSAYLCVTPEDGGDVEYRFSPRLPVPDGMTFNAVAHDGSRFVAVGKDGVIITSVDGKVWRMVDSATSCNLNGIAVGEGRHVVVGDEGYVLSSDDGEHWWQRRRKGGSILRAVVHANDRFVAVGACGEVIFSDDGGSWMSAKSGVWQNLHAVSYGGGKLVAVGDGGMVLTSTDGQAWERQDSGTANPLRAVAYGGGRFIAVGDKGTVLKSSDGIDWTGQVVDSTLNLFGICHDGTQWLLASPTKIWLSLNQGDSWTSVGWIGKPDLRSLSAGGASYVAVGKESVLQSDDAIVWKSRRQSAQIPALAGEFNGKLIGFANQSSGWGTPASFDFLVSEDGLNWDKTPGTMNLNIEGLSLDHGVMTGLFGSGSDATDGIYSSTNGVDWIQRVPSRFWNGSDYTFSRLINSGGFWGGKHIFVGVDIATSPYEGYIATSEDGINWQHLNIGNRELIDVAFGNGVYVATGKGGRILRSTDAETWTAALSGTVSNVEGLIFHRSFFYAIAGGSILKSENGSIWTLHKPPFKAGSLAPALDHLIAQETASHRRFVSTDGETWEPAERNANPPGNTWSWGSGFMPAGKTLYHVQSSLIEDYSGSCFERLVPRPLLPSPILALQRGSGSKLKDGATLDFGTVPKGGKAGKTIRVVNNGSLPLKITAVAIQGGNSSEFRVEGKVSGMVIPPKESKEFSMSFRAGKVAGKKSSSLLIASNDPLRNPTRVTLSGRVK